MWLLVPILSYFFLLVPFWYCLLSSLDLVNLLKWPILITFAPWNSIIHTLLIPSPNFCHLLFALCYGTLLEKLSVPCHLLQIMPVNLIFPSCWCPGCFSFLKTLKLSTRLYWVSLIQEQNVMHHTQGILFKRQGVLSLSLSFKLCGLEKVILPYNVSFSSFQIRIVGL